MDGNADSSVEAIVREFHADRGRLLDVVEQVQHRFGRISDGAIQVISTLLGIHRVEIEDMVSFYAFFNREPRGRFRIRLSKTPISIMKGAKEVGSRLVRHRLMAPLRSSGPAISAWPIKNRLP